MKGFAPLFLILFAGLFMVFSVTILDHYWLKNPNAKQYFADKTNPVVTSETQLASGDQQPSCSEDDEDDPADCSSDNEGDNVDPSQLAAAD